MQKIIILYNLFVRISLCINRLYNSKIKIHKIMRVQHFSTFIMMVSYSLVCNSALKLWLDDRSNFEELQKVFNSTSGYARLVSTHTAVAGRLVFVRFRAETGDAMGMNMLSKVREEGLEYKIIIKLHL